MKEARKPCKREHDFTLVLNGVTDLNREKEDALFEAGCDDATPSIRFGRVYLTFSRAAPTLKDAIFSAITDVRKAGIGADVLRVDVRDLVTQADIARRISRSRQLIHQYVGGKRGPGSFPPPVCHVVDESPLWAWREVAQWLWNNGMIKEDLLREAQFAALVNDALVLKQHKAIDEKLTKEVLEFIDP